MSVSKRAIKSVGSYFPSVSSISLSFFISCFSIDIFENEFRKIKEATGVSDVNEVIQKITTQESTTDNLINLTRENQGKIELLNETKRKLKIHVEEMK